MTYKFTCAYRPDLAALEQSILASSMSNKAVEFSRWDQDIETDNLAITFTGELSVGDINKLAALVDAAPEVDPW